MTWTVDWPWMLAGAGALAMANALLVVARSRRRAARLRRLAERHLLERLAPSPGRASAQAARVGVAALLGGVALAGPRWGEEATVVRGQGVDVVLALDASLSMLATDERPSRLERVKQEVRRYRALSPGDRVAMLAFAGRSYILTPLTVDEGAIELFLDNLDPSIVGQAGSSLARTIVQGTDLLRSSQSASDRAVVIMSDGEAFESMDEIVEAARAAATEGISIITVGFGTAAGSTIPVDEDGRRSPKRDADGDVVVTRYNPATLRAIAVETNGTFVDASVTDKASRVREALSRLRSSSRNAAGGVVRTPRFQWFILPALLLLIWDTVAGPRRRRRPTSLAAASASLVAGCALPNQVVRDAGRAYETGRIPAAIALYRRAIREGDARPELYYNVGTALVAADSLEAAAEPLERSGRSGNPEIRFRALFNAGLARLEQGLALEAARDSARGAFRAAVDAYKQALLLRPTDRDAKWNYELALRKERQSGGGGGGGGGGGAGPSSADEQDRNDSDTPQSSRPSGGLGQQRAEQLLDAAAREERGVQGRRQKQSRPQPPPGGRDW